MVFQGNQNHFLIITFPAQGYLNPALQLAKRLVSTGAHVTFVTSLYAHQRMIDNSATYPDGLTFSPFSDGFDDGCKFDDVEHYMSEFERYGIEALSGLVEGFAKEAHPITCLIYTLGMTWASEVARKYELFLALLWIQPATVFDIYYYYFTGYRKVIVDNIEDPSYSVKLPGLPLLKGQDLPSFLLPTNIHGFRLKNFQNQFEQLSQESKKFRVLVNTFDELESEALKAVDKFNSIAIGPLIPSEFLGGGNLFENSNEYSKWLDSKDSESVVYVSFGSISVLTNKQMEELARGLVDSGRPFLWVIRSGGHGSKDQVEEKDVNEKYNEILLEEHNGMIVPWCSQVEVLNHPSVGCFVTHCGWNSTLETLAMGVPVVAFPQWVDQGTNAKLVEDVWKIGVRVKPNEQDKIVESGEIIRCLEEVMEGERGKEFRNNAKKWKGFARLAVKEGGSSERNLKSFVEEFSQV